MEVVSFITNKKVHTILGRTVALISEPIELVKMRLKYALKTDKIFTALAVSYDNICGVE